MTDSSSHSLARIFRATGYSWQGLRAAWRHEAAFREETYLAVILIPLGLYVGDDGVQKAMLVASVLLVLVVEMINSAIEASVDRHGSERHELSGRAKDMASTAVVLAFLLALAVWLLVLFVD
jgi:diacylglycerol kinase (ATP)